MLRSGEPGLETPGMQAKAALRRALIAARRASEPTPEEVSLEQAARTAALLAWTPLRRARNVAIYIARSGEPDTRSLRAALAHRRVRILLPRLLPDDDLSFAVDDGRRTRGRHGAWEPTGPPVDLAVADLVLVPALAVDRSGTRLGRGGGSYDRALARVRPGVPVVALVHPGEFVEALPREPHDRPVVAVALPGGVTPLPQPPLRR